jgi:hemerythrin superfamily protein
MASPRTDAISMLKADHEKVRGLLAQLEKSTEQGVKKREQLLSQIAEEVTIHTTLEEEIFYPSYRDAVAKKEDRKLYQEAIEEHHVVDLVMPEIEDTDPGSEVFSAKAKVLKEIIEHHAEEEEKEMFPRARKAMEAEELRELGQRMEARRAELKGAAEMGDEEEEDEDELEASDEEGEEGEDEDLEEDELEAASDEEIDAEMEEEEEEAGVVGQDSATAGRGRAQAQTQSRRKSR